MHLIKLLEEKSIANEVDIMLWSNRMDLVAIANCKGEVSLHRLTWVRVWWLPPPKENDLVCGLAWRPDGKILAIGYKSGAVLLVSVEDKSVLYSYEIVGEITCINWVQDKEVKSQDTTQTQQEDPNDSSKFLDSSVYLSDPDSNSPFDTATPKKEHAKFFQQQSDFNLLLVGTKQGILYISIFGCFLPIKIDLSELINCKCSIISAHLSENFNSIITTICDNQDQVKMLFISTDIFRTHKKELFSVALKYESICFLLNNLMSTITNIKEHLESILMEMDLKLSKFASKVPEGTLAMDFLDMLMVGLVSDEMQEFLLNDLTKKGLEKFGQTIELSYDNIQKLLLKYVNRMCQSLAYHLSELRGMSRLDHKYEIIGLQEDKISETLEANGNFMIKCAEMQHIITESMICYKAFFRWLYSSIMILIEEPTPPEMQKMTQQDVACIAEFLLNFNNIGKRTEGDASKSVFMMERLGQYLEDKPLSIPPKDDNEWEKFVLENECIREHTNLINYNRNKSLVQQFNELKGTIDEMFVKPIQIIGTQVNLMKIVDLHGLTSRDMRVSSVNINAETTYFAFLSDKPPAETVYLMEFHMDVKEITARAGRLYFAHIPQDRETFGERYHILDVKFYSVGVLSLLFQENSPAKQGVICQFPFTCTMDKIQPVTLEGLLKIHDVISIDCNKAGHFMMTQVQGMKAFKFAVSGQRNVSIVLSDTRRKVHLYEMEADEEEEEDNELTTSTVKENDVSIQDNSDAE